MFFRGVYQRRIIPYTRRGCPANTEQILRFSQATFTNTSSFNRSIFHDTRYDGPFASGVMATKMYNGRRCVQLEGARENLCDVDPQDPSTWTEGGSASIGNAQTAPDDSSTAGQVTFTASATDYVSLAISGATDDTNIAGSWLAKTATGTHNVRVGFMKKDGNTDIKANVELTTTWQRIDHLTDILSGATTPELRLYNGSDAHAGSIIVWNPQAEENNWPTSIITDATTIRNKDELYWPAAKVPAWIRQKKHAIRWIPQFASTDSHPSSSIYSLYDYGGGNTTHLWIYLHFTNIIFVRYWNGSGWTNLVESNTVTFSRNVEGIIVLDPAEGSIEALGITGGDKVIGTEWASIDLSTKDCQLGQGKPGDGGAAGAPAYVILSEPYRI